MEMKVPHYAQAITSLVSGDFRDACKVPANRRVTCLLFSELAISHQFVVLTVLDYIKENKVVSSHTEAIFEIDFAS